MELECTLEAIDEELRRGMTVTPAQIRLHMVQRAPAEFGCIRVVVRRTRVVTLSLSTQPSLGLVALVGNHLVSAQMLARPAVQCVNFPEMSIDLRGGSPVEQAPPAK